MGMSSGLDFTEGDVGSGGGLRRGALTGAA